MKPQIYDFDNALTYLFLTTYAYLLSYFALNLPESTC